MYVYSIYHILSWYDFVQTMFCFVYMVHTRYVPCFYRTMHRTCHVSIVPIHCTYHVSIVPCIVRTMFLSYPYTVRTMFLSYHASYVPCFYRTHTLYVPCFYRTMHRTYQTLMDSTKHQLHLLWKNIIYIYNISHVIITLLSKFPTRRLLRLPEAPRSRSRPKIPQPERWRCLASVHPTAAWWLT